jgi:outer membrane protein assembly factor BamD
MVRNVQEVLADKEMKVGIFYLGRGNAASASNRLQALADQFPLYSKADEALWSAGIAYRRLGARFENLQASAYTRIVKDYPLSPRVEEAKAMLEQMERPIPEADPVSYARMKYEIENRTDRSLLGKAWGPFSGRPDMSAAAKSGTPQMTGFRPTIPETVPEVARGGVSTSGEVIAVQPAANVIDKAPEARSNPGSGQPVAASPETPAASATPAAAESATTPAAKKGNTKVKNPPKPKKKQDKSPAPPVK